MVQQLLMGIKKMDAVRVRNSYLFRVRVKVMNS